MISSSHWRVTPTEAVAIQRELAGKITLARLTQPPKIIAGVDVSLNLYAKTVFAGFVVMSYPHLEILERVSVTQEVDFPYIPGLLSFRELPPLLAAWEKLTTLPDLVFVDGIGIAHPRRIGIASHLGLLIDRPTIGCAKSVLMGVYQEPEPTRGSISYLYASRSSQEIVGAAVRTKNKVKPVFVSPGYRITTDEAVDLVLNCTKIHRLPEPTRQAHLYTNEVRKAYYQKIMKDEETLDRFL